MALALCNAQGELTPLEIGLHAIGSGLTQRAYADKINMVHGALVDRWNAAKVGQSCRHMPTERWRHLAEIHAAPRWLWPALVAAMVDAELVEHPKMGHVSVEPGFIWRMSVK
jgi:hypothetical protein